MPIRHCQKCGLKVLIDDSQSAINPFFCQRCTTAMKNSGESPAPAAAGASATRSSGTAVRRATAASASAPAAKSATVKVLCPYCKASFNGRIPQKPARGACPVCQKELILLPTGDIRAAAGFDAMKWQAEQTAAGSSTKESGTKTLVKKYAAAGASDPGMAAMAPPEPEPEPEPVPEPVAAAPAPPADTAPAETDPGGGGGLPSWLDDEQSSGAPAPAPVPEAQTEPELEPVKAEAAREPEPIPPAELPAWLDDASSGAKAVPEPAAAEPGAYDPTIRIQPDEEAPAPKKTPPPPPRASSRKATPAPPPPAPKAKTATGRKAAAGRRTGRHTAGAAVGAKGATGFGTVLLAYVLLASPLVACPILLKQKEKFKETPLDKIGARFQRGFEKIYEKWFTPPPPPAPAPAPAPKPVEEEAAAPTAEDKARDKQAINDAWIKYRRMNQTFKQRSVGATPAEKAAFKKAEEEVNALKAKYDAARKYYRDIHKEDYDPTQE